MSDRKKTKQNTNCCVPLCRSRASTHKQLSFHKFPHETDTVVVFNKYNIRNTVNRRKLWVLRLRMGKNVSSHMVVCSKHFQKEDFFRCPGKDGNIRQRNRLKRTAVPSLCLPIACTDKKEKIKEINKASKIEARHTSPISPVATLAPRKVEKMETVCCADHCNVSSGEGYSFYSFPEDKELRSSWIIALRRKGFIPTKHSRICARHFTSDSFIQDSDGFSALKQDAVPSKFEIQQCSQDPSTKYIRCFVPGCKSKCLSKPEDAVPEKRRIHLFKVPYSERLFKKWKYALSGFKKELTRDDHICELHFKDFEIERFYSIRAEDGSVTKLERTFPSLISGAFPRMFLDSPEHLEKDETKLPYSLDQADYNHKKQKCSSGVSDSSIDSQNEVTLEQEKNTTVNKGLTFHKVLENLHLIKKPNSWWNIAPVSNFIMCARWDDNFIADKRIVIGNDLTVRVFLKEWEINITDLMDITCIDDISTLLEKVESYNINFTCS